MIGLSLVPPDARILFVGLGGGAMPTFVQHVRPGARLDVVEIDSLIIDVATRFFGLRPDSLLVVHAGDGRAFIEQARAGTWDLIVLDAFSDDEIPYALATRPFLEAVRSALAPGGIVVSNVWGSNAHYSSMLATYAAVFENRALLRVGRGVQRIVVASADRRIDDEALERAAQRFTDEAEIPFDLSELVKAGREVWPRGRAPVLEDHDGR